jgi:uncharacterized protein YukE
MSKNDSSKVYYTNQVFMDSNALDIINFNFEEKIKELETLYTDMNNKLKILDGTDDTWRGKAQETFYDHYTRVSAHFPDVIDQLNAYSLFLAETIETYNNRDKDIDEDIDNNEDKIDVN